MGQPGVRGREATVHDMGNRNASRTCCSCRLRHQSYYRPEARRRPCALEHAKLGLGKCRKQMVPVTPEEIETLALPVSGQERKAMSPSHLRPKGM
jgi:hypothetical protein